MPLVIRNSVFGSIYKQTTQPQDVTAGNIWTDTSVSPPVVKVSNGTDYEIQNIELPNGQVIRLDKAIIALG